MSGLSAMRAAAAACTNGSGEQEVEGGPSAARCRGKRIEGAPYPAIDKGVDGAQHPALRQRLLQRSLITTKTATTKRALSQAHNAQPAGAHLNPGDADAHDAQQEARSPVPRRPRARVHASRRGRQSITCRRRKADRRAMPLSWGK